jgi:dTDP-4-amino-4,6-dideoxygalactose transaminase
MLSTSLSPWPAFDEAEIGAVADVLRSGRVNYWTGDEGRRFETEFAAHTGSSHAVALANGTLALDVALHALGIGPGDEVVVTPRTFLASASCVANCGAVPVFADVDANSGNLDPARVAEVLTPRTKAIIPVHLGGFPCDMTAFMTLAADHGLAVIEDCAQAHGALSQGRPIGALGTIGAWSFCQDKIITTGGEGGMVTTNDRELWSRMWSFKDHGKSWEAVYERPHPPGYRWLHESFGTNWRMLEIQAVIGRRQLARLPGWTEARARNAQRIAVIAALYPRALRIPEVPAGDRHAYYRLYLHVRAEGLRDGWDRDRIIAEMNALDAPVFQGSCSEVYLEKAFEGTGWAPRQRLPVARELGETSLAFLTHPTLTESDMDRVTGALARVMDAAAR